MKIIWVNGCFDVLHRGHIEMLKYAKSLGDILIVGIDADWRVKEAKGSERPFNNEEDRKFMLESIKFVDKVMVFETDSELRGMIHHFKPELMVVGSDWEGKSVVGSEYSKDVCYFSRVGNYSTTKILEGM
jgi:D-beta-D-heptose 7-phosphate kinase/D-beta-D-heptose 1-phosphate adenosyltransferase